MLVSTRNLQIALLMALTVAVSAASTVLPKGTVIPVVLDTTLSSKSSDIGDLFYAHPEGDYSAGIPQDSRFVGKVTAVKRATKSRAGQINVSFVSVQLPDGRSIAIKGQLALLDKNNVVTNSKTGRLVGTKSANNNPGKFIAIGAGAGLLAGELGWKKPLIGTLIGAAAGYIYGTTQNKAATGKDVQVKEGTSFGVLLKQAVTIPNTYYQSSSYDSSYDSSANYNTDVSDPFAVTFDDLQPVMYGNNLMVPLRSVMDSIDMPFDYDTATRTVSTNRVNSSEVVRNAVGSRLIYVDNTPTRLDTASRMINGSIYVPADYIELLTEKTAYWNQNSRVLRLE